MSAAGRAGRGGEGGGRQWRAWLWGGVWGEEVAELEVAEEFVAGDFGAHDGAGEFAVVPVVDADEPGDGGEEVAGEDLEGEAGDDGADDPVGQGEQAGEGDEHGNDVEPEVEAVACAGGGGFEDVVFLAFDFEGHVEGGFGGFGFGAHEFADDKGGGGGHDFSGEDVFAVEIVVAHDADVDDDHAGGHGGEAAGHDGVEFGAGHFGEVGADGEGSFGLSHEDVGGHAEGFSAGDAHGDGHDAGEEPDEGLHDAAV